MGLQLQSCFYVLSDPIIVSIYNYSDHIIVSIYSYNDPVSLQTLRERGCDSDDKWSMVLEDVEAEVARRKRRTADHLSRSHLVASKYMRLHPSVYVLSVSLNGLADGWSLC